MKKYIFLVLLGLTSFLSSNAFANEENASSGYNTPTVSEKFVFSAVYENGAVKMKWTPFTKGDEEVFKYFKVVSSRTNSNPVYPEDGYLTYSSDMAFSSYTNESPKPGTTWYRICAIYEKSRVCSPVVKITIAENSSKTASGNIEKEHQTSPKWNEKRTEAVAKIMNVPKKNVPVRLDDETKAKLDTLISNFKTSLESKYTSTEDRITYTEKVIKKANALRIVSPKLRLSVRYIVEKLNELIASYEDNEDTVNGILKVE